MFDTPSLLIYALLTYMYIIYTVFIFKTMILYMLSILVHGDGWKYSWAGMRVEDLGGKQFLEYKH